MKAVKAYFICFFLSRKQISCAKDYSAGPEAYGQTIYHQFLHNKHGRRRGSS